jgi:hypothetical protein
MEGTKYIGRDVHKDTISGAVRNAAAMVVMESILETQAATMVQFIRGRRGNLRVTPPRAASRQRLPKDPGCVTQGGNRQKYLVEEFLSHFIFKMNASVR